MSRKSFDGKKVEAIAKSEKLFDQANPDEATYGNTRVAQKALWRVVRSMVELKMLDPAGDDVRFFDLLNKYFYALQKYQLDDLYAATTAPLWKEEEPPIGGSNGGLLTWFVDHWGSK